MKTIKVTDAEHFLIQRMLTKRLKEIPFGSYDMKVGRRLEQKLENTKESINN